MDKVKKFWQTIIKEREGFWSSLFNKYEEDKQDVDLQSYMHNSSSRIDALLQLVVEEDEASEHACTKVTEDCDKQSCELSDAIMPFNEDITKAETKEIKLKDVNHPVPSIRKAEPTFVVEILPEEDDETWKSFLHPTKRLKLSESSMRAETDIYDSVTDDQSTNSSENSLSEDSLSEFLNDSIEANISVQSEPLRYVCRRVKSGSIHAPSPKRFKLA